MFSESRLDLGINYGATFGPRFNTAIATQANGEESRRPLWSEPLIYAQLGEKMVNGSELEYLLDFHTTVQGAYSGFRLRDWSDFYAEGQSLLAGPTNTYQLIKTYTVGVYSVVRPITKPVADTVKLYANGVEQLSGWTIDTTTGVLTTAIAGTLTVDFEFDVPVRFEQDQISFRFQASSGSQKLFNLAPLNCTEIRLLPTVMPTLTAIPSEVAATISLGYDYRTTGGPQFNTLIATTASEFEDRIPLWDASLGSWEIGDRTLNRSELDYLLAWFRVCRGQSVPFSFYDWQSETTKKVRFSEDRISFTFQAYRRHDKEAIFTLGGAALRELPAPPAPVTASYWFYELTGQSIALPGGVPTFNGYYYWGDSALNTGVQQGGTIQYLVNPSDPEMGNHPVNIQFTQTEPYTWQRCNDQYWQLSTNGSTPFFWDDAAQLTSNFDWTQCTISYITKPTPSRLYRYTSFVAGGGGGFGGSGDLRIFVMGVDYVWNSTTGQITWFVDPLAID